MATINIKKWLCRQLGCCKPKVVFDYRLQVRNKRKIRVPMEIKLTNEQEVDVTLAPKTEAGLTAKLDGSPGWQVMIGECEVIPSEDGLTATIVSSDTPGTSQILVEADADLGDGVETISAVITVEVTGAKATNLGLSVGSPRIKRPSTGS